jgi:hypothetical protein
MRCDVDRGLNHFFFCFQRERRLYMIARQALLYVRIAIVAVQYLSFRASAK